MGCSFAFLGACFSAPDLAHIYGMSMATAFFEVNMLPTNYFNLFSIDTSKQKIIITSPLFYHMDSKYYNFFSIWLGDANTGIK